MELFTFENLAAFIALVILEIVLGIDNVVFIAILTGRLDRRQQPRARRLGLGAATVTRVLLLLGISWIMGLVAPLFSFLGHAVSGRDLILLGGGLFLVGKATFEIHDKLEGPDGRKGRPRAAGFWGVIAQVMLLDVIFSLDSVITAVGMARSLAVMVAAVVAAVGVMVMFADAVSVFIERHPTMKMLALSFLILIGVVLVTEGMGKHVDRAYIYFAMGFSLFVEMLNLRVRGAAAPVKLKKGTPAAGGA